jgi:multidrug efflux pump
VAKHAARAGRALVIYLAIVAAAAVVYTRLPTSFLPNEDQGTLLVNVQLPPGATQQRTLEVMKQVEGFMLAQPEVQSMVGVLGFSFSGQGQNAALAFVTLKDWAESGTRQLGQALAGGPSVPCPVSATPSSSRSARRPFPSWAIVLRLQLPTAGPRRPGHEALMAARNQMLGMASQSKPAGPGAT